MLEGLAETLPSEWYERLRRMRREDPVYKPAALLSALDLIDAGEALPDRLDLARCGLRFDALLESAGLLAQRRPGRAFMPLYYLSTASSTAGRVPFWSLLQGSEERSSLSPPSSLRGLLKVADTAAFLPALRYDLATRARRQRVRWALYSLLETDGRPDSVALLRAHDPDEPRVAAGVLDLQRRADEAFQLDDPSTSRLPSFHARLVRDRAFRQAVVGLYQQACALCGLRLRWNQLSEVEAAHIKPRAARGPDDLRNALALCRTHHWAFDHGLWTASDDLVVRVQRPRGEEHELGTLVDLEGRPLRLPRGATVRPHREALEWHRDCVFEQASAG